MRLPRISVVNDPAKSIPSRPNGTAGFIPACTDSNRATSSTQRPIGPSVARVAKNASAPASPGTKPHVGRKPYTLQNAAGLRKDPIMSDPSATGSIRAESPAAAPPDDPPAVRVRS